MDRRNFSLLAVTGFLGLAAAKTSKADNLKLDLRSVKKLSGTYETTGNGSAYAGSGPYLDNGTFTLEREKSTESCSGTITFYPNGTGKRSYSLTKISTGSGIGGVGIEVIDGAYEFNYKMIGPNSFQIYISPGSWRNCYKEGLRKDHSFDISLINSDRSLYIGHYSEGFFSPDGNIITFRSAQGCHLQCDSNTLDQWTQADAFSETGIKIPLHHDQRLPV